MSLIKRPSWPTLTNNNAWLTDFFDNRAFDSNWLLSRSLPAVNVKETEHAFELELAAPGLEKKDLTLVLENGILTISSERERETKQVEQAYRSREFNYASFSRSFTLPENTNQEDITAIYENGILKLTVAKKEVEQTKGGKAIEVR